MIEIYEPSREDARVDAEELLDILEEAKEYGCSPEWLHEAINVASSVVERGEKYVTLDGKIFDLVDNLVDDLDDVDDVIAAAAKVFDAKPSF